jgi:hypothetical protein
MNDDFNLEFRKFLNEIDVKSVHLSTRKSKPVTNPYYPFYLIKDYLNIGYWDKVKEKDFKKAYDDVMEYLLTPDTNTKRISELYNWETDYDILWQYQLDKQD